MRIEGPAEFAPRTGQSLQGDGGECGGLCAQAGPRLQGPYAYGGSYRLGHRIWRRRRRGRPEPKVRMLRGVVEIKNAAGEAAKTSSGSVRVVYGSAVRVSTQVNRLPRSRSTQSVSCLLAAPSPRLGPASCTARRSSAAQNVSAVLLFKRSGWHRARQGRRDRCVSRRGRRGRLGGRTGHLWRQKPARDCPGRAIRLVQSPAGARAIPGCKLPTTPGPADFGGIRLKGQPMGDPEARIEEGIGMSSSSPLTAISTKSARKTGKLGPEHVGIRV